MDADLLARRLRPFLDAGLLTRLPTRFQIWQGEAAMLPYVLSSDATDEARYARGPLGHPLLRQVVILAMIGRDHLDPGCSLGARFDSVATHLLVTVHQGMPVFDLQLLHTHPHGLARFRSVVERHLSRATPADGSRARWIARILADPDAYHRRFLGDDGFIARAERFDYPAPEAERSDFPPEFFSLAGFLQHCAQAYPPTAAEVGWTAVPGHLLHLAGRRFREGRGLALGARRALPPADR